MERKVGEIFNANGTILQVCEVKESDECNGCFFKDIHPRCLPYICAAQEREDGKNVQFKEIRKTMDREEVKKLLPIMQAFADGKTIQYEFNEGWRDLDELNPFSDISKYRIKPEPKCRPFKNQEECWQEMMKHYPFGWFRSTHNKNLFNIVGINDDGIKITNTLTKYMDTYSDAFDNIEFVDGTPFGVIE